jgi:ferric-dicitrate binding protein FerR (iron transport regulator)
MSTAFSPIDSATIASLNAGDEAALEKIFRSHYDVLLERALERLQDEKAAAPRLVSAVVRALWDERDGVHSTTEIEGFLNEEFRQRARAIRSRMAAVHRFEKSEGVGAHGTHAPPTADQLWKEIATGLHQPVVDAATAAKNRREQAAHGAAEHMRHATEARNWKLPALLTVVGALCLWGGYTWASKASKVSVITQMLAEADAPQVVTRAGQLGAVSLADSSRARLGADTKIVMVKGFGREYRSASVAGTAAIAVASGNALPLEVRLGDAAVFSDGAEFAVRDFADEPMRFVLAKADGVRVKVGESERTLKSGELIAIPRGGAMRDATAEEATQAFSWLDGKLVLRDVAVRDAMHELFRWYGLDIAVVDTLTLDRKVSLEATLESTKEVIAAMESGAQLKFEWVDNRMTFKDGAK